MAILTGATDPLNLRRIYDEAEKETRENETGDFMGGLKSGTHGLLSSGKNFLASGARLMGAKQTASELEESARESSHRAAGIAEGANLKSLGDIKGPGDFVDWLQGGVASQLPLLGSMALTGGPVGAIARGGAAALGAASKAPTIARLATAASKSPKLNSLAPGGIYFGTSTGDNYGSIINDPDAKGTPEDAALASMVGGAGQATLGMLFGPEKLFRGMAKKPGSFSKAAFNTAMQALGEGATEMAEEVIQTYIGKLFNPERELEGAQLAEAGALGAVLGGGFAAPGQFASVYADNRKKKRRENMTPQEAAVDEYNELLVRENAGDMDEASTARKAELEGMFEQQYQEQRSAQVRGIVDNFTPETEEMARKRVAELSAREDLSPPERDQLDVLQAALDEVTPTDLKARGHTAGPTDSVPPEIQVILNKPFTERTKDEDIALLNYRNGLRGQQTQANASQTQAQTKANEVIKTPTPGAPTQTIAEQAGITDMPAKLSELKAAKTLTYNGKKVSAAPIAELYANAVANGTRPTPKEVQAVAQASYDLRYSPLEFAAPSPDGPMQLTETADTATITSRDGSFEMTIPRKLPDAVRNGITMNGMQLTGKEANSVIQAIQKAYYEGSRPTVDAVADATAPLLDPRGDEIFPERSSDAHKISRTGGVLTIENTYTGDKLEMPDTYMGIFGGKVKFNNKELSTTRSLFEAMLGAVHRGRQLSTGELIRAASRSAEYSTKDVETYEVDGTNWDSQDDYSYEQDWVTPRRIPLRPTPLQERFGFKQVTIKNGNLTDPGEYQKLFDKVRQEMAAKGYVIAGVKDNHIYFGTPAQRDRFYTAADLYGPIADDAYMVERAGVLLAKEAGARDEITIPTGIQTHDDKTHDGLMYIIPNATLTQGFSIRKVTKPDGKVYYEFDKGLGRSPLGDIAGDFTVEEDGSLRVNAPSKWENPSINTALQLGHTRAPGYEGANLIVYRMKPVSKERGGTSNLQQILFSLKDPLGFLVNDRQQSITGKTFSSLISGQNAEKVGVGIDPRFFLNPYDAKSKLAKYKAQTSRAYTLSSTLVSKRGVKLLPDSYKELNDQFKLLHGRNLEVGEKILVHRDPSMADATSMDYYTFEGIMVLQNGDTARGIVVNPNSKAWKEAAGDFDGDSGVATIPTEYMQPAPSEALGSGNLVKGPSQRKHPLNNRAGFSEEKLRNLEGITAEKAGNRRAQARAALNDMLSEVTSRKANAFSQMIGMIISQAQALAEVGVIDEQITIPLPLPNGSWPAGVRVKNGKLQWDPNTPLQTVSFAQLISKIGQASISAKKKATWVAESLALFSEVMDHVRRNNPIALDEKGQEILEVVEDDDGTPGKQPINRPYFVKAFRAMSKAPRDLPTFDGDYQPEDWAIRPQTVETESGMMDVLLPSRAPITRDEHWEWIQAVAEEVLTNYAKAVLEFGSNPDLDALLTDDEKGQLEDLTSDHHAAIVARLEAEGREEPPSGTYDDLVLDNLDVEFPVELVKLVDELEGKYNILRTTIPGYHRLLRQPVRQELARRALDLGAIIEDAGGLDLRPSFSPLLQKAARASLNPAHAAARGQVEALKEEYMELYKEMRDLAQDGYTLEDPQYEALLERARTIEAQITLAHALGRLTAADLIVSAPERMAAKIANLEQLRELSEFSAETGSVNLLLTPATKTSDGQVRRSNDMIESTAVPMAALYKYDSVSAAFELYSTEGGKLQPTGQYFVQMPFQAGTNPDISMEAKALATLTAPNNGFVVIRRKPNNLKAVDSALERATQAGRAYREWQKEHPGATESNTQELRDFRAEYDRLISGIRWILGSVVGTYQKNPDMIELLDPNTKLSRIRELLSRGSDARQKIEAAIHTEAKKVAEGKQRRGAAVMASTNQAVLNLVAPSLKARGHTADGPYQSDLGHIKDGRTRRGVRTRLNKLNQYFDKAFFQGVADIIADMFGLPRIEVINADRAIEILNAEIARNPQNAAAMKRIEKMILDGKWDGTFLYGLARPTIYVSGKYESKAKALEIIAHEMAHYLVDEKFNGADPATVAQIKRDFVADRRRDKKSAAKFDAMTPLEQEDAFHEYLADHIGKWVVSKELPKTPQEVLFKALADALKSLHELIVKYAKSVFPNTRMQDTPAALQKFIQDSLTAPRGEVNPEDEAGPNDGQEPDPGAAQHAFNTIVLTERFRRGGGWDSFSPEDLSRMIAELYVNLHNMLTPTDYRELANLATQPDVIKRMNQLLGNDPEVAKRLYDPGYAIAYMYVLASAGILRPPPKAKTLLQRVWDALNELFGGLEFTAKEQEQIFNRLAFRGISTVDPMFPPNSTVAQVLQARAAQRSKYVGSAMTKMGLAYRKAFSWYTDTPGRRLVETRIPALMRLARVIQPLAWEISQHKIGGYAERSQTAYNLFAHSAGEIVSKLTPDQLAELEDAMFTRQTDNQFRAPTYEVREAIAKLDKLFEKIREYENKRGVPIQKRNKYWPFMLDKDYIKKNLSASVRLFTSTDDLKTGWESVRAQYLEWVAENGTETSTMTNQQLLDHITNMTVEEFVEYYLVRNDLHDLPGWELKNHTDLTPHAPGFRFKNPRLLDFMLPYANRPGFRDTFVRKPGEVLQRYIRAAAKRGEYTYMMKELHTQGLEGLLNEARAQGATEQELRMAVEYIDSVNGILGLKERDSIDGFIKDHPNSEWMKQFHSEGSSIMNEKLNNFRNFLMMWQVISKLTLSVFSSLIDPFGQLLLHGDGKIFAESMKQTYKNLKDAANNNPNAAREFLDTLGIMEHRFTNEDIMNTYHGPETTPWMQKIMTTFFRYNGVEWVTDRSREASGLAASMTFIKWKDEAASTDPEVADRAKKMLGEFGLSPDDVVINPDTGALKILSLDEKGPVDGPEWLRDDRVRTAVNRFVDQAQIRPDATNRPLYSSNPYYALFAQWKPFITAFDEKILQPTWERLAREGNATPFMWMLLTFVPVMLFADMVRDAVKTAGDDDDDWRPNWKDGWTMQNHLEYAIQRAGLYGRYELVNDILEPLMGGRIPDVAAEMLGPTAGDVNKLAKYGPGTLPVPLNDAIGGWN